MSDISTDTGLTRKEVASVFECMSKMIKKDLGTEVLVSSLFPGLMKVKKKMVPRRPARKNVFLPLLGEYRDLPAKQLAKLSKLHL